MSDRVSNVRVTTIRINPRNALFGGHPTNRLLEAVERGSYRTNSPRVRVGTAGGGSAARGGCSAGFLGFCRTNPTRLSDFSDTAQGRSWIPHEPVWVFFGSLGYISARIVSSYLEREVFPCRRRLAFFIG